MYVFMYLLLENRAILFADFSKMGFFAKFFLYSTIYLAQRGNSNESEKLRWAVVGAQRPVLRVTEPNKTGAHRRTGALRC
jgi:hypothetical protein